MMKYRLQDLIDIEHFQSLQDRLNKIYSFPSAIIDNDGNILTATAWQDICTKFHRQNEECKKECIKSDQYILSHLHEANPAVSYKCPHGLIDNATPIIIDGVHYGNYFTGQFFLDKPDFDYFRAQAKKYGFDEDAYIAAVRTVPVWSKEQLESYLFFIKGLIEVMSGIGLKNLTEAEARKNVQESEERHRTILQTAMDGFWLTDAQGHLMEVNQTYCRMSGYDEKELLAMSIPDLEVVESAANTAAHMKDIISRGEDRFESRHRRKDGSLFDVEVSVQYRQIKGGRCVVFLRDISERKQADIAVRESKWRLENIIEGTHVGTWEWNVQTGETIFNEKWAQIIGYTLAELAPISIKTWEAFSHPDDAKKSAELLERHFAGEQPYYEYECRMKHKNGEWIWIHDRGQVITRTSDGKALMMFGTHSDITERKRAEEALRKSEENYRLQFQNMNSCNSMYEVVADTNGKPYDFRFALVNQAYEDYVGIKASDLIGKTLLEVYPETEQYWIDKMGEAVLTGLPIHFENYSKVLSTYTEIDIYTTQNGQLVMSTANITARKKAEEALRQAQKMESIGTLAGGIAHDFNNLLNAVLGQAALAIGKLPKESPATENIVKAIKAADRATNLTRQLLAYSGKGKFVREEIDLNKLVKENVQLLEASVPRTVQLHLELDTPAPFIHGDIGQIQQIVMNLIINAGEAMGLVSGLVGVKTSLIELAEGDTQYSTHLASQLRPGTYALLQVSDEGCGMSDETMNRIFDPFFSTKFTGRGLGLAAVLGIVRGHHGGIRIETRLGEGTRFDVVLPALESRTSSEDRTPDHMLSIDGRGITVLVIDDEPSVLELLTDIFKQANYSVMSALSPKDGIDLYHQHHNEIAAVVLDYSMPGMDGKTAFEELARINEEVKVILCSGYTEEETTKNFGAVKPHGFLQKPYKPAQLLERVSKMLSK